ncbi:MAG: hypothetical protein J2P17_03380 [Mycobacterium sp.]|nr:hypothetical protein [Mycobacterium sp.]
MRVGGQQPADRSSAQVPGGAHLVAGWWITAGGTDTTSHANSAGRYARPDSRYAELGARVEYELQTLQRALQCVDDLAAEYPQRLVDLTRRLRVNQTTMLRTLRVLERYGYVRRAANGQDYFPGPRLIELGHASAASIDILSALAPWTTELSRTTRLTVHVGMLRDNAISVIAKLDAPESRVRYSALGTRMPLHATAAGKAALALLSPSRDELEEMVTPMREFTPYSIREMDRLVISVEDAARLGFSMEIEEYNLGFSCVGTALELSGEIYTVSLSGPAAPRVEMLTRGKKLQAAIATFLTEYAGAMRGLVSPTPNGRPET